MYDHKVLIILVIFVGLMGFESWLAVPGMTDEEHGGIRHFEREDQHNLPFLEEDNEGNETAGQIAALILLVANLPVAVSILIKGTNKIIPLGAEFKRTLTNINKIQKKTFMRFHYYLNLIILGIVFWHWLASRCKSSVLPEIGLIVMVILIVLGFLMKFNLCPKFFRKSAYQIHTQPVIFISMFLVLVIGHLIVD